MHFEHFCLWMSFPVCLCEWVLCFLPRLFWSGVCQSEAQNTDHVTLSKGYLFHTVPFKAPSPISQPFQSPWSVASGNGSEFDGGLIFVFSLAMPFISPSFGLKSLHISSTDSTNALITLGNGLIKRERDAGKGDCGKNVFLVGEWQMRFWASDALAED